MQPDHPDPRPQAAPDGVKGDGALDGQDVPHDATIINPGLDSDSTPSASTERPPSRLPDRASHRPHGTSGTGDANGDSDDATPGLGNSKTARQRVDQTSASRADTGEAEAASAAGLLPGSLASRYRLIRVLGKGGFANVYLAHDKVLDQDVAIKILKLGLASKKDSDRFLFEARVGAKLRHPNIATVFDIIQAPDGLQMVMEYYPHGTLTDLIKKKGPLKPLVAIDIARQVAHALAYAHRRSFVHRDVKPANIFLAGEGMIKLGDFGIASHVENHEYTQTGMVIGTPLYMAPEQATDSRDVDPRADIYALGLTLYHMLTGKPPRVIDLDMTLPQFRRLIKSSTELDRAQRLVSCEQFVAMLDQIQQQMANTPAAGASVAGGTGFGKIAEDEGNADSSELPRTVFEAGGGPTAGLTAGATEPGARANILGDTGNPFNGGSTAGLGSADGVITGSGFTDAGLLAGAEVTTGGPSPAATTQTESRSAGRADEVTTGGTPVGAGPARTPWLTIAGFIIIGVPVFFLAAKELKQGFSGGAAQGGITAGPGMGANQNSTDGGNSVPPISGETGGGTSATLIAAAESTPATTLMASAQPTATPEATVPGAVTSVAPPAGPAQPAPPAFPAATPVMTPALTPAPPPAPRGPMSIAEAISEATVRRPRIQRLTDLLEQIRTGDDASRVILSRTAFSILQEEITENPDDVVARFLLALAYRRMNDQANFREAFQMAMRMNRTANPPLRLNPEELMTIFELNQQELRTLHGPPGGGPGARPGGGGRPMGPGGQGGARAGGPGAGAGQYPP